MKKQVMIVDDEPTIRETVTLILEECGYTVIKARNGRACLEEMRKGFKGIILMDILMPGLTGWDTIRAIIAEKLLKDTLICMLTGQASPGENGAELEEHVFDYLTKPFCGEDLMRCVENAASVLVP
ncbi:MAG: response regulator [Verrucomicrobia bacterium]|nr:response regulator [Verrucomicrobiota bacterium]